MSLWDAYSAVLPLGLLLIVFALGFLQWRSAVITAGWRRAITVLLVLSGLFSPALPPSSGGLFERILIIIDFAWLVILASRILMQERSGLKAPGA